MATQRVQMQMKAQDECRRMANGLSGKDEMCGTSRHTQAQTTTTD